MLSKNRLFTLSLLLIAMLGMSFQSQATNAINFVTGNFFIDKNLNGLMDEGELNLSGIQLRLMQGEQEIQILRTNDDGSFSFNQVPAGDYYIKTRLPDGYIPTRYQQGGSELIPSSNSNCRTVPFRIGLGDSINLNLGAISFQSGSFIRVIAFGDDNLNGGRFSSEPLLRDVEVELLIKINDQFYVVDSGKTDKEGSLTLPRVAPGEYVLGARMTGDYIIGPLGSKLSTFYNTILPGEAHYGQSLPFTLPEKGSLGLGIGGALTGSGEGTVWDDLNFNGLYDIGEPGISGVELKLKHQSMGVERSVQSREDGSFTFPILQPGDYTLTAILPDRLMFTQSGGDSIFFANDSRSQSKTVQVTAQKRSSFGKIGAIPNTALSVSAFHDSNVNGLHDEGEPVFAGANLTVFKEGLIIAASTTDSFGVAQIPLLRAGEYELNLSLPDGQIFSINGGENGNRFFSTSAASQVRIPYTLLPGKTNSLIAGATLPGTITGALFIDKDNNAIYDSGEEFQPGFTVQAVNSRDVVIAETITDEKGSYQLSDLIPGDYQVRILLKSPFIFSGIATSDAELVNQFSHQTSHYGQTDVIKLQAGQQINRVDGAIFRSAVIEGDVLLGDEADQFSGILGGLENVFVELLDEDGQSVSEYTVASTDDKGHYFLKGALPGIYSLRYHLPENSAFSNPLSDEAMYTSSTFNINASDELLAKTLYAVKTGSYAGTIYIDNNINGIFDAEDQALDNVKVLLQSETDKNSRLAISAKDGSYILDSIRPGNYQLLLDLPEGLLFSFDEASPFDPGISSRSNAAVQVGMGMRFTNQMIAALPAHQLAGSVYYDNDLDTEKSPGEPGYENLELRLRHELSRVEFKAVTDSGGRFSIPVLFPGQYTALISLPVDYVLYTPGNAINMAGNWEFQINLPAYSISSVKNLGLVQFASMTGQVYNLDGSQQGVNALPIRLITSPGGEQVASTLTEADGRYQFTGLYPGQYMIELTVPEDYRFVREIDSEMARFSLITSDSSTMAGSTGTSAPFVILMSENKEDQSIGICTLAQIGDFAWLDLDHDGMQDAGEPGVPEIELRLYQYGLEVAAAKTDAYGRYRLSNLYPGLYTLEVTMPTELKSTIQQTEFHLVSSILPETEGTVVSIQDFLIESGSRNLNVDFGFVPVKEGVLPATMLNPPKEDWTPYAQIEPMRVK